jgi:phosphocarrier protein
MAERRAVVANQRGLHARAAARFAQAAEGYDAAVTVTKDGQTVDGGSLMDLLMLGAAKGATLIIRAEGPEAEEAASVLAALVGGGFGEDR